MTRGLWRRACGDSCDDSQPPLFPVSGWQLSRWEPNSHSPCPCRSFWLQHCWLWSCQLSRHPHPCHWVAPTTLQLSTKAAPTTHCCCVMGFHMNGGGYQKVCFYTNCGPNQKLDSLMQGFLCHLVRSQLPFCQLISFYSWLICRDTATAIAAMCLSGNVVVNVACWLLQQQVLFLETTWSTFWMWQVCLFGWPTNGQQQWLQWIVRQSLKVGAVVVALDTANWHIPCNVLLLTWDCWGHDLSQQFHNFAFVVGDVNHMPD